MNIVNISKLINEEIETKYLSVNIYTIKNIILKILYI
jgi:hypothetical protein